MSERPTLLSIRQAYNLSLEAIAKLAQISPQDIYAMEAGVAFPQATIDRVLTAVSLLTGKQYTREHVGSLSVAKEEGPHE